MIRGRTGTTYEVHRILAEYTLFISQHFDCLWREVTNTINPR